MRIVIPGGTGQLGTILVRELESRGHDVVVLSRSAADPALRWDGRTDGPWFETIDGADAVINLVGRSVNCRYTWANLNEMMASRVESTLAIGRAIAAAEHPPSVWLQASTASIYAHTFGPPNDESSQLGGHEPDTPDYWAYSTHIGRAWELALASFDLPHTRTVAMRLGFAMSPDADGVFDVLSWLVESGLGGPFCGGEQFVTWISDHDLGKAVAFLLESDLDGPVNVCAPQPIRNRDFMAALRAQMHPSIALPITGWMARIGAVWLKTDPELMLKSRRVVPRRLLDAGFQFDHSRWEDAAPTLVSRRARRAERRAA